jgi:hypothetical protein
VRPVGWKGNGPPLTRVPAQIGADQDKIMVLI